MGDFLTAVKTVTLREKVQSGKPLLEEIPIAKPLIESQRGAVASPEDALEILRSQPDTDVLEDVLIYLSKRQIHNGFNIRLPSPSSAKIINELISTTIPDFWDRIEGLKTLLLDILRSVAGISALVAQLRLSISQYTPTKEGVRTTNPARPILDLISILSQLLRPDDVVYRIFNDTQRIADNQAKTHLLWKEFLATVTSGRIVSAVAQAEQVTSTPVGQRSWLSDGSNYSTWLGRTVSYMMQQTVHYTDISPVKAAAQVCGKGFNIGYAVQIVEETHIKLSLSNDCPISLMEDLLTNLLSHERRQFLHLTMKFLARRKSELQQPAPNFDDDFSKTPLTIMSAASLLRVVGTSHLTESHLATWLSDPAINCNESFAMRRAALSALMSTGNTRSIVDEDPMQTVLESNWKLFGDNLFIKHTPIVQQEACAQILLMAAGYVHRSQPMFLFTLARSSLHMTGTSNRLNASSLRARFLGMVVGMGISELVDKENSRLTFDLENTKTLEARWYCRLVRVNDQPAGIEEMRNLFNASHHGRVSGPVSSRRARSGKTPNQKVTPKVQTAIQGPRVMEVLDDDDEDEDEDLVPYEKPDSDPEDEDEDPTLVNRNKPKSPVYIRDLIVALHDTENHDRHIIALKAAAALIRRKSSFGKEVSDHAIELALIIVGLSNTFDIPEFPELRLQSLIAILVSNPSQLAPWFSRQVFEGDYSLSQRSTLLSVVGLSARELAGYGEEDEELNPKMPATAFPSKKLPDRLHKIYAGDNNTALIASNLEKSFIQPLAARAVDDMSGPNALKVRTFSSRMEVEKRRKKPITNTFAKVVAESFFFPLTGRWWQNMQAYGSSNNVHFQPFLLSTYLKTLAIMLHASGPSTLSLPQMTSEFWELLLSVRTNALADVSVLEAVLFCFLTLLEVNEDQRRLAEEHSKELVETQQWIELVFEKSNGGDNEGERIRMLAAGVLVKTREIVEKYQRLLVGSMLGS